MPYMQLPAKQNLVCTIIRDFKTQPLHFNAFKVDIKAN